MNGVAALSTPSTNSTWTDQDLVLGTRDGSAEAAEELARRGRKWAFLLALQMLGNAEEAKDIAQDSMMRFFSTLDRFDSSRPVRPWLLTIVRNRVRDQWRRRKSRPTVPIDGDLSIQIVDRHSNPERDARRAGLRRRVWKGISAMSAEKKEILILRDFHDLSYAELARVLAVPQGTVMSRLHRARAELREILIQQNGRDFMPDHQGAGHDA